MANQANGAIRPLRIKKSDNLKTIYEKVRGSFTAADLQKYTEIEEMFPAEKLVAEMEAIHREELQRNQTKAKKV